jgi:hypothetical protein
MCIERCWKWGESGKGVGESIRRNRTAQVRHTHSGHALRHPSKHELKS